MTVEEKAKRYDESLEIAKKNYITARDLCEGSRIDVECFKNILESIFPNLKESVDNRIRKELIEFIKKASEGFLDSTIQCKTFREWHAWLKKQGKDKEINNFDVLPGLYKCVHRMFDGTPEGKLREEIKYASKDYVNYLLDKQEYHNEIYTEYDIREAFEKGAMFVYNNSDLSSLWHDPSEMPNNHSYIMLMIDRYTIKTDYIPACLKHCQLNGSNWNEFAKDVNIKKWAYIKDLLPKGKINYDR